MLSWKLRKRQILPANENFSLVYFSLAKFQLVTCNLSLAMIWKTTYTQTAKTVFRHLNWYKCFLTQNFSPLFCHKYLSYLLWSLFYGRCRDAQENNNESFLPCSFGVVKVKLKRLWQNDPRFAQVKFWCAFVLAFSSDRINKLTLNCLKYSETWTIYKAENIYLKNLNGLNTRSSSEYWPSVENVLILLFQYIIF